MTTDDHDGSRPIEEDNGQAGFTVEPLSHPVDAHYVMDSTDEIRSLIPRPGSRIAALTDQLHRSQANLESTSARFNQVASAIPGDIANLSDRLSGILTGAMAEAEDIRAEARRFAHELQGSAEKQAAAILDDARSERRLVAELRSELEAQRRQVQIHTARLREQAMLSAVEMMREAESQAVEILTQMNSHINTHVAEAQARLNELMEARLRIMDRVTNSVSNSDRAQGVHRSTES